jgi:hypothetical protein
VCGKVEGQKVDGTGRGKGAKRLTAFMHAVLRRGGALLLWLLFTNPAASWHSCFCGSLGSAYTPAGMASVTRLPTVSTVVPTVLLSERTAADAAAAAGADTSTLPVPEGVEGVLYARPSKKGCSSAWLAVGRSSGLYAVSCSAGGWAGGDGRAVSVCVCIYLCVCVLICNFTCHLVTSLSDLPSI